MPKTPYHPTPGPSPAEAPPPTPAAVGDAGPVVPPAAAALVPPPPTLLQQAEHDLAVARRRETEAKRAVDYARAAERERLVQAWGQARQVREQAEALLHQRQRALASAQAALPSLRVAARRSAGAFAVAREEYRRQELRLQREKDRDATILADTTAEIVRLAGDAAISVEEV